MVRPMFQIEDLTLPSPTLKHTGSFMPQGGQPNHDSQINFMSVSYRYMYVCSVYSSKQTV
jgi:hypothetical protein